jgi:hypothetical protein
VRKNILSGAEDVILSGINVSNLFVYEGYIYFSSLPDCNIYRCEIGKAEKETIISGYYHPSFSIYNGSLIVSGLSQGGSQELIIYDLEMGTTRNTDVYSSTFYVYRDTIYTIGTSDEFENDYKLVQITLDPYEKTYLNIDMMSDDGIELEYFDISGVDSNNIYLRHLYGISKYSLNDGAISRVVSVPDTTSDTFMYGEGFCIYCADGKLYASKSEEKSVVAENVYNFAILNNDVYIQNDYYSDWYKAYTLDLTVNKQMQ